MAKAVEELKRTRPDRVPPHNLEAEESVLGSMMLSPEAIASVVEILNAEDFYRGAHRRIYETLLALYARGEPVDAITTVEELKRRQWLDEVGGPLYVYNLVESVPTPASASHYAKIVSDRGKIRARRVSGNCAQHQRDVATAVKNAREMALLPYTAR